MEEGERAPRSRARHVRSDVPRLFRRQADAAEAAAATTKQQQGKAFSLRAFHDTLLGNGTAPFWLHRQLMLGDDTPATCSSRLVAMPLYEYQCDACGHRFERDPEVLGSAGRRRARSAARPRQQARCRRPRFSSRAPAGTSPTTRRRIRAGREHESRSRRSPAEVDKSRRSRRTRKSPRESTSPKSRGTSQESKSSSDRARHPPTPDGGTSSTPPKPRATVVTLPLRGTVLEPLRSIRSQIGRELLGEVRPPQREIDHRLQEAQLVAGVVADALRLRSA